MSTWSKTLTVLLSPDDGGWVAQTLEHDVAAQGADIAAALDNLRAVLLGQFVADVRAGRRPLEDCPPAPASLFARVPARVRTRGRSTSWSW